MAILDDLYYKCVQLELVIMLISITITPVVSSDKTSHMSFCFFGTSKFVAPGSVFDVYFVVFQ